MMKRICAICCGFLLTLAFSGNAEAISNKAIHWGFSKAKTISRQMRVRSSTNLLQQYDAFYLGNTKEKTIYLTFDNGYENGYTPQVLDVLKKQNVKAAFFVTGHFCPRSAGADQANGRGGAYHRESFISPSGSDDENKPRHSRGIGIGR